MDIQLIDNSASDCNNPGLACLGCPNFDNLAFGHIVS